MQLNVKDLIAGAFFTLVGLVYGGVALTSLRMGTATNMGPGYFPVVLSGIMICLGAAVAARGFVVKQETPLGVIPWRGAIALSLATIVFATSFERLGILPCVFVTTLIATQARPNSGIVRPVIISLCIALFCTALFAYAIRLPVSVFGTWFGH